MRIILWIGKFHQKQDFINVVEVKYFNISYEILGDINNFVRKLTYILNNFGVKNKSSIKLCTDQTMYKGTMKVEVIVHCQKIQNYKIYIYS